MVVLMLCENAKKQAPNSTALSTRTRVSPLSASHSASPRLLSALRAPNTPLSALAPPSVRTPLAALRTSSELRSPPLRTPLHSSQPSVKYFPTPVAALRWNSTLAALPTRSELRSPPSELHSQPSEVAPKTPLAALRTSSELHSRPLNELRTPLAALRTRAPNPALAIPPNPSGN